MNHQFKADLVKIILNDHSFSERGYLASSRKWRLMKDRADENLFFTLIAYEVIKSSKYDDLTSEFYKKISENLVYYKNKDGGSTYNFWRTQPNTQWPNSHFIGRFKHFWIPDDLDCTALSYQFHSSTDFDNLRTHMQSFTNHALDAQQKSTTEYYSTWFGVRMKPEFDICVCVNYLLILKEKELQFNQVDQNLLKLLENIVCNFNSHNFFKLSPNYQRKEIVLWHFARLFNAFESRFATHKNKLLETIEKQVSTSQSLNERVWLKLTMLELKEDSELDFSLDELKEFMNSNDYFYAPMLYSWTFLPDVLRTSKFFNVKFYSKAFNAILILRYFS